MDSGFPSNTSLRKCRINLVFLLLCVVGVEKESYFGSFLDFGYIDSAFRIVSLFLWPNAYRKEFVFFMNFVTQNTVS